MTAEALANETVDDGVNGAVGVREEEGDVECGHETLRLLHLASISSAQGVQDGADHVIRQPADDEEGSEGDALHGRPSPLHRHRLAASNPCCRP